MSAYTLSFATLQVVNADQTGHNIVPVGKRTYAVRGSKTVKMLGHGDKRQVTLLPSTSAGGDTLPVQVRHLCCSDSQSSQGCIGGDRTSGETPAVVHSLQVIFQGKTAKSLPPKECCKVLTDQKCEMTCSPNHWANMGTMKTLTWSSVHGHGLGCWMLLMQTCSGRQSTWQRRASCGLGQWV
jgi:hypothetical protein